MRVRINHAPAAPSTPPHRPVYEPCAGHTGRTGRILYTWPYYTATGKMRTCGSADFATGSGENYGLRLAVRYYSIYESAPYWKKKKKIRVCLVLGLTLGLELGLVLGL